MNAKRIVILGAGPAGLGAAERLARRGKFDVTVIERSTSVGGNAGSFEIDGLRVDFGSHRLHPACEAPILDDIRQLLGDDLLDRPRHGRIRLHGRWLHFPLKPLDLAANTPGSFLLGVARDAVTKLLPARNGQATFATLLERGLGRTICRDFYFPYAAKIWGLPPDELDAEQARRRVAAGSLLKLARKVASSLPGLKPPGAGRFFYPRRGFGQISEAYAESAARHGARVVLGSSVAGVHFASDDRVVVRHGAGDQRVEADLVLSTIPLTRLIGLIEPAAPEDVLAAAAALRSRAMLLVYLVLETDQFTGFDAHYFPEPSVAITRLSEPKNYGLAVAQGLTVLCAELPCATSDKVWSLRDEELGALVIESLERAALPVRCPLRSTVVRRLPEAYPIYARQYAPHFERLDAWVGEIERLVTFGRQGLFVHDNTHHTLAMAYALNQCLADDAHFDRKRWARYRQEFQKHVVED